MRWIGWALVALSCSRERIDAKRDDAAPVATKSDPLEGVWRADASHRRLEAKRSGELVEFRVLDPTEWHRAYEKGEVRFALARAADGTLRVTDRYRPFLEGPNASYSYTPAGRDACLHVASELNAKPLAATLLPDGGLKVEFVEVTRALHPDLVASTVVSCGDLVHVGGPVVIVLHRIP